MMHDDLAPGPEWRCIKCRRIPWDHDEWDRLAGDNSSFEIEHHDTFDDLEKSAAEGCALCCSLRAHTFYLHPSMEEVFTGPCKLEFRVDSTSFKFHVGKEFSMMDLEFLDNVEHPPKRLPAPKTLSPLTLDQDLPLLVQERIKPWINSCIQGSGRHSDCAHRTSNYEQDRGLPTRLIDVGDYSDADNARLLVSSEIPNADEQEYLILSYCWGRSNEPAKTTRENYAERLRRIDTKTLPKTVADAIKLTRLMGERYLWVDAICIIQSWREDAYLDDWKREAPKMGQYYSKAKCLISAMAASDSNQGIFTEREVARFPTSSCPIAFYKPNGEYIHVPVPQPFPAEEMACQPLLRRGWCLQEWILSPRILLWSANELLWQCTGVPYASESVPDGYDMEKMLEEVPLASRYVPAVFRGSKDEALGTMWRRVVAEFQLMDLTYKEDRIAAVQGLGEQLANFHSDEYFATVFRSHIAEGLAWVAPFFDEKRKKLECFPSWSFASCETRFEGDWHFIRHSLIHLTHSNVFPESRSKMDFTNPPDRLLRFQAPLLSVDLGHALSQRSWRNEEWGFRITITFDDVSLIPEPLEKVNVVLLASGDEFANLLGLVVSREGQFYKRLGFAGIHVFTQSVEYMPDDWGYDGEALERDYGRFRADIGLI